MVKKKIIIIILFANIEQSPFVWTANEFSTRFDSFYDSRIETNPREKLEICMLDELSRNCDPYTKRLYTIL